MPNPTTGHGNRARSRAPRPVAGPARSGYRRAGIGLVSGLVALAATMPAALAVTTPSAHNVSVDNAIMPGGRAQPLSVNWALSGQASATSSEAGYPPSNHWLHPVRARTLRVLTGPGRSLIGTPRYRFGTVAPTRCA